MPEALEVMYEVLSCIKHTDQKQVYILLHKETGNKAVLKYGSGMYRRILKEEQERLLQMDGNGFPRVLFWEEQPGKSFLIREYVEGDTVFMGTRGLASPEQFGYQQTDARTDARTDVYGLGIVRVYSMNHPEMIYEYFVK